MNKLIMMIGAAAVAVGAMLPLTAVAANYWWTGVDSRAWGNANNWLSGTGNYGDAAVATKIPGSDTIWFMSKNGSDSVFSDRFTNDGYIVEFDKGYNIGYALYFNTDGAKVTFKGTGENASLTYNRSGYNKNGRMGIGDTTDSTLRIEGMTYTHSYTNLVLGWSNGIKGNLEIASDATVNIPSTAGWCDGLCLRHGSSLLVDGGTLDCAQNVYIGWASGSITSGDNVVSNINGTVTAATLIVGGKGRHGQYIQKGGTLTTTGDIILGHNWTSSGSAYFEVDGGTVTVGGATTNKNIYVGQKGWNTSSMHMVVKGDSEVNCYNLLVGYQSPGVADIEGGVVRCENECRLSDVGGNSNFEDDSARHPQLNLLGGVLVTSRIKCESTNSYSTVLFNGGTLREHVDNDTIIKNESRLYVKVGANGGTIDTNGLTTRLPKTIETGVDSGTDGGMTFTGGGTLALQNTASLSYTGDTRVTSDTTLSIPAKNKVDLSKFVCLVDTTPSKEGKAILTITGSDTFDASDLAQIRLADGKSPASTAILKLSRDGKSVLCKKVNGLIISFF